MHMKTEALNLTYKHTRTCKSLFLYCNGSILRIPRFHVAKFRYFTERHLRKAVQVKDTACHGMDTELSLSSTISDIKRSKEAPEAHKCRSSRIF
jgi:hypothetical protein